MEKKNLFPNKNSQRAVSGPSLHFLFHLLPGPARKKNAMPPKPRPSCPACRLSAPSTAGSAHAA